MSYMVFDDTFTQWLRNRLLRYGFVHVDCMFVDVPTIQDVFLVWATFFK